LLQFVPFQGELSGCSLTVMLPLGPKDRPFLLVVGSLALWTKSVLSYKVPGIPQSVSPCSFFFPPPLRGVAFLFPTHFFFTFCAPLSWTLRQPRPPDDCPFFFSPKSPDFGPFPYWRGLVCPNVAPDAEVKESGLGGMVLFLFGVLGWGCVGQEPAFRLVGVF